ncbi:hypothetical protein MNBD_BACTEROID03-211 [hydrothermal vent metagenome]|uniref:HTH cro/C1-type domain-containing protein n=1 Tax=hydrothermal vent metagenome TaxID=652676 RepID=A0A3B0SZ36_9ZZZZ
MKHDLGAKIRKIRALKGYTQDYMAAKLDVSQRAYSKLENNEIKLDWNRLTDISKILEIDPVELISFDDSLIFHNCSQSGKLHTFNNFPEDLKKQYENQIAHLKEEIKFLREKFADKK